MAAALVAIAFGLLPGTPRLLCDKFALCQDDWDEIIDIIMH